MRLVSDYTGIAKKSVRYLIITSLFAFFPEISFPQKILDPEFVPPNVRWDNFLIKSGEASQKSTCIMIDRKGFLWSGTETGLYRYDGIRYVEYGVSRGDNKGFTGYTVTDIFEDSDGTIWIGTSKALNKLDPKTNTFLHYYPDSAGKQGNSNFIRDIREDSDGLLWIRTSRDIYCFERVYEKFTRFAIDSLSWYPKNDIYSVEDQCFLEDISGNKWFVTFIGLYLFNNKDKTFRMVLPDPINADLKDVNSVKCIAAGNNGTVWIGTEGGGLLRYNDITDKPEKIKIQPDGKNKESFNTVTAILPDKDGSIWCFGNSAFSQYNPADGSARNYMFLHRYRTVYEGSRSHVRIDQAFQYNEGTIWFLNKEAGLMFRFQPSNEKLSLYRTPTFIVFQCIMDQTESFWFACIRNNISRLVTRGIPFNTSMVNNTSYTAQTYRGSILEDDRNNIWFLFNRGTYISKDFNHASSLVLEQIRFPDGDTTKGSGFKDSKGNLWFGTRDGKLTRYNIITHTFTGFKLPWTKTGRNLFMPPMIREDKEGNIWIVTPNNGLFRLAGGNGNPEHVMDFNLQSGDQYQKMLLDFLIDSQGEFWIITAEYLLRLKLPEKKIVDYSGYGNDIFSVFRSNIRIRENTKGEILILNSQSGLYIFNRQNDTFTKVDVIDEDPGTEYYDLLIDRNERLWVAHNKGITIYDQKEKESHTIKTQKLQYDLQSYQVKSGEILYLNDNQLYIFYESIPLNDNIPPVYLTRLLVNGTDYNKIFPCESDIGSLKQIELPFRLNTLNIEFAALNYLNPERNQYRYFMKGSDRDTALTEQGIPAEFKNMPPGRYRFWVTGSNNDGLWNPSGVSLDILIHPPWYWSVLADVIYVLVFISLVAGYIRFRTYRLTRDKIRMKAEIETATANLEIKNRQLAEIDRVKTHFFTDISHEIRTPLSLILGPLENISREEMLSSRMSGMIDLMKGNAQRLMHLVNQLLDISRLDAGKMKITLSEDDIVKCLRILVYEFLSMAESKQINYIADLPEKSYKTWFDRDKIEKIISNLLTNAFKFTPQKGKVQCVVKIEYDNNENSPPLLKIRVLDSGPGISKEHQERIFDRFYRVEEHHEAGGHGTGIGLSLVREFVSLLHGEIEVGSTPGEGSDFSIILPLGKNHLSPEEYVITQFSEGIKAKKSTDTNKQKHKSGSVKQEENGEMTILIIEDNEDLRKYIRESLYDDYNIREAENGRTGINTAFTIIPDLIVTDIMMPDLDGIKLCSQLKNDERTSHIPIIILTAKATIDDRIAGLRSGADDYMFKPFNMTELKIRISNLLELRDKLKIRYAKLRVPESGKEMQGSVDDRFMARAFVIINANLRSFTFDVASLHEQLGMSRTHLSRKLKILTGLSPGTLIRNIRLERAAELLVTKSGNITEIANSLGISNPSNFTKSFRKYFGVSPKDYPKH